MSDSKISVQEAWDIVVAELMKQENTHCFFVDNYGHLGEEADRDNLYIYNIHGFEMKSNLKGDKNE